MKPLQKFYKNIFENNEQFFGENAEKKMNLKSVYDLHKEQVAERIYKPHLEKCLDLKKEKDCLLQEELCAYYTDLPHMYLDHLLYSYKTLRDWVFTEGTVYLQNVKKVYDAKDDDSFLGKYGMDKAACQHATSKELMVYYRYIALKHMFRITENSIYRISKAVISIESKTKTETESESYADADFSEAKGYFTTRIDSAEDIVGYGKTDIIDFKGDDFYNSLEQYLRDNVLQEFGEKIQRCKDEFERVRINEETEDLFLPLAEQLVDLHEALYAALRNFQERESRCLTASNDVSAVPVIKLKQGVTDISVDFQKKEHSQLGTRITKLQKKYPFIFSDFCYYKQRAKLISEKEQFPKLGRTVMEPIPDNEKLACCAVRPLDAPLLLLLLPTLEHSKYSFFTITPSGTNAGVDFDMIKFLEFNEKVVQRGIRGFSTIDTYLQAIEIDHVFQTSFWQDISLLFNPELLVNLDTRNSNTVNILKRLCKSYQKHNPNVYSYYFNIWPKERRYMSSLEQAERVKEEQISSVQPLTKDQEWGPNYEERICFTPYIKWLIQENFDPDTKFVKEMDSILEAVHDSIELSRKEFFAQLLMCRIDEKKVADEEAGKAQALELLLEIEEEIGKLTSSAYNAWSYDWASTVPNFVPQKEYDYQLYYARRPATYSAETLILLDELMQEYFCGKQISHKK